METTLRAGIPYPDGTDANNFAAHMQSLAQKTDDMYPILREGLLSARPGTPEHRSMYWATNDRGGKLYYGDGSSHFEIGPSAVAGPVTGFTGLIVGAPSALVSDVVLGVRGKPGQTGDLIVAQSTTPTTKFRVDHNGSVYITDTNQALVADQWKDSQGPKHRIDMRTSAAALVSEVGQSGWTVVSNNTSATAFGVFTVVGQTGLLQEWTVGSTRKAYITAAGDLHGGILVSDAAEIHIRSLAGNLRGTLSFDDSTGAAKWQLLTDTTVSGATDIGLWNAAAAAFAWSSTSDRAVSVQYKLTVGGSTRQSTAATLDVFGDIGIRETDAVRITDGANPGRVIFQDSVGLYMGAIDQAKDLFLRAQGSDIAKMTSVGLTVMSGYFSVGTSTLGSGARARIDTGGSGVSETALSLNSSPNTGFHALHIVSNWGLGSGGDPIYITGVSSTPVAALTNLGYWKGMGGSFGNSAIGGTGAWVTVSDDGFSTAGAVKADGPATNIDLFLLTKGSGNLHLSAGTGTAFLTGNTVNLQTGALTIDVAGVVTMSHPVMHYVGSGGGNPAFQNSWGNFGGALGPARFWKDANGILHLAGNIVVAAGQPSHSVAFTLPSGFTPATNHEAGFPAIVAGVASGVGVHSNGDVEIGTVGSLPTGGSASLDGMSFPTWTL